MENIGKARPIAATHVKIINEWTTITRLVTILIRKDGILRKADSIWKKEPWTIDSSYEWNYQDSMRNQIGNN